MMVGELVEELVAPKGVVEACERLVVLGFVVEPVQGAQFVPSAVGLTRMAQGLAEASLLLYPFVEMSWAGTCWL
jgi:hypothetical protein